MSELDSVPTVEDFAVRLTDDHRLEMISRSAGRVAWFPAWEHADRDLRHFIAADVPLGAIDEPYEDADEGWRIRIFEHAGWVYIFEADAPDAKEFARSFRVRTDVYVKAWAVIIDLFNPITPLDESESADA
jgi:hypothetical protein